MSELDIASNGQQPAERPGPVDPVARLASLTQRAGRPTASIFGRRLPGGPETEAASTEPTAVELTDPVPDFAAASPAPPDVPVPAVVAASANPVPANPVPSSPPLGRLSRVTAAQLWTDDGAMAGWMAGQPELVCEVLGVTVDQLEVTAGNRLQGTTTDGQPFHAACEVRGSSAEALASLLAIAALQDGGTVAWIAGETADTHGATLSWLNRTTPPRFFFVRATGVRIGDSASAPTLDVVVRPGRDDSVRAPAAYGAAATLGATGRRAEDHEPGG